MTFTLRSVAVPFHRAQAFQSLALRRVSKHEGRGARDVIR